ncbi:uncharacterized protein PFL1_02323 [Pseudozyma flocculosa PF-1]|uniref:Uncharacterized protein n=1 Tax=Pseudozyma flocculosa TaxID=84751 RepID=A0A5C3F876_9BASI|nr:uncharacterized protein PFL1_02323 [Pseudozyma flocculosa PF-1]EPQ30207.1 hypothetical protein PFL1_02323 [Pseudozyma flocculosa PF-1]SPO39865.1 uncharacterized protein PSFLO_05346 [Pseudozyma flocculosa]
MLPRPRSKALPATPSPGEGSWTTAHPNTASSTNWTEPDSPLERFPPSMPPKETSDLRSRVSTDARLANGSPSTAKAAARSGSIKGWSPRWAPKVKRNWPSPSSGTVAPAARQAIPSSTPSPASAPAPALSFDSDLFDQTDLSDGLFPLPLRSPSEEARGAAANGHRPIGRTRSSPSLTDPDRTPIPERLSIRTFDTRLASPAMSSLTVTPSHFQSNPSSSPALAGLISSFPSPIGRAEVGTSPPAPVARAARNMGWDGGENWAVENRKHAGERFSAAASDASSSAKAAGGSSRRTSREGHERGAARPSSSQRLVPPGPAPDRALPPRPLALLDLNEPHPRSEPTHGGRSPLKRLTLEGGPPSSPNYQTGRQTQKANQKPAVASGQQRPSSSSERLSQMTSQRNAPATDVIGSRDESLDRFYEPDRPPSSASIYATASSAASSTTSLVLGPTASTGEIARSLDIPRDAIKQMLETTQHVWRNHSPGAPLPTARAPPGVRSRLKRVKSSPDLHEMDSFDFTIADEAKQVHQPESSESRRASISTLPYLSSTRPSSEAQSPSWITRDAGGGQATTSASRGASLDAAHERRPFRKTYIGGKDEEDAAPAPGRLLRPNFSRPIPPGSSGSGTGGTRIEEPSNDTLSRGLGSPVQLGMDDPTSGRTHEEEDEEVLLDVDSEQGHAAFAGGLGLVGANRVGAERKIPSTSASFARPTARSLDLNRLQALATVPQPASPPRIERRNSESGVHSFGVGRDKRQPGELHAWSVVIDETGFPAIRTAPSAFHHPACPLAGKGNATWQCGCRGFDHGPSARASISGVPRFGAQASDASGTRVLRGMSSSPNLGARARASSAGNAMEDARQAALWQEVERHRAKISELQATVERISLEIASSQPSLSLQTTPDLHGATSMHFPTNAGNTASLRSMPASYAVVPLPADAATGRQPLPAYQLPPRFDSVMDEPALDAYASFHTVPAERTLHRRSSFGGSLRRRLSSLNRSHFDHDDEGTQAGQETLRSRGRRLRTSSSTSSLNKLFSFPWSAKRGEATREAAPVFPQPTPFPYEPQAPTRSTTVPVHLVAQPPRQSASAERPLPSVPSLSQASRLPSRKYPPSARKFSFDALSGRGEHSSVSRRHSRDQSGSSKASSYNTGGMYSDGSEAAESRFSFFPRAMRRWDSLSSRATSMSERSMERSQAIETKPAEDVVHRIGAGPESLGRLSQDSAHHPKPSAPPRRSSLRSVPGQQFVPTSPTRPSLHLLDMGMAPISEMSEAGGTPNSLNRRSMLSGEFEASPASFTAGTGRISMSERYVPKALSIPTSLPPSSAKEAVAHSAPAQDALRTSIALQRAADKPLPALRGSIATEVPASTTWSGFGPAL